MLLIKLQRKIKHKLAFTSDSNSLSKTKIIFAEESGEIASFTLTGLETETISGESQSITVTAIDADGLTVTDYTGTVHFSSTDSNAVVPGDYPFVAADLGQHNLIWALNL